MRGTGRPFVDFVWRITSKTLTLAGSSLDLHERSM
jgi:hypothetical protein